VILWINATKVLIISDNDHYFHQLSLTPVFQASIVQSIIEAQLAQDKHGNRGFPGRATVHHVQRLGVQFPVRQGLANFLEVLDTDTIWTVEEIWNQRQVLGILNTELAVHAGCCNQFRRSGVQKDQWRGFALQFLHNVRLVDEKLGTPICKEISTL